MIIQIVINTALTFAGVVVTVILMLLSLVCLSDSIVYQGSLVSAVVGCFLLCLAVITASVTIQGILL